MAVPTLTPTWTRAGVESLRDLYRELSRDRPKTARRTIEAILDRIEALSADPERGRLYDYSGGRHIRVLTYGPFEIAYLLEDRGHEERSPIAILGIFHGFVFLPR